MFLVLGESLIDMVGQPDGSFLPIAGGAPYNFARALALQGVTSGYLNAFSNDAFGVMLQRSLIDSGALHLGSMSDKPSSLAFVATDADGQPQYSFYRSNVADRDFDQSALLARAAAEGVLGFHTGGLALVPPDDRIALDALQRFRAGGAICSVDANVRPQVARSMNVSPPRYRDALLEIIGAAHIVKVSDQDLQHLGFTAPPESAARALLAQGCPLVVLTLGAAGAWVFSGAHALFQPAAAVQVVDTVGAGDCFFAGFIAALWRDGVLMSAARGTASADALQRALAHATRCAAINIGRKGCAPPTWQDAQSGIVLYRPRDIL